MSKLINFKLLFAYLLGFVILFFLGFGTTEFIFKVKDYLEHRAEQTGSVSPFSFAEILNKQSKEERPYVAFDSIHVPMNLEDCVAFITQSPEASKKVGLELSNLSVLVEDAEKKILIVRYEAKSKDAEGFAIISCVDGFALRVQYVYSDYPGI